MIEVWIPGAAYREALDSAATGWWSEDGGVEPVASRRAGFGTRYLFRLSIDQAAIMLEIMEHYAALNLYSDGVDGSRSVGHACARVARDLRQRII